MVFAPVSALGRPVPFRFGCISHSTLFIGIWHNVFLRYLSHQSRLPDAEEIDRGAQSDRLSIPKCMMNPNEPKFTEGKFMNEGESDSLPSRPEGIVAAEESELDAPSGYASSTGDVWAEGRERLAQARQRTQLF